MVSHFDVPIDLDTPEHSSYIQSIDPGPEARQEWRNSMNYYLTAYDFQSNMIVDRVEFPTLNAALKQIENKYVTVKEEYKDRVTVPLFYSELKDGSIYYISTTIPTAECEKPEGISDANFRSRVQWCEKFMRRINPRAVTFQIERADRVYGQIGSVV